MSRYTIFFWIALLVSLPQAKANGKMPAAIVRESLEQVQTKFDSHTPYLGSGPQFAAKLTLGFVPALASGQLWDMQLSDNEHRLRVSEARIAQGLTEQDWASLFAVILEAAYDGPFRVLELQELSRKLDDPLRRAEAAGLEANFLNRLHWAISDEDQIWDLARYLAHPERGDAVVHLVAPFVTSLQIAGGRALPLIRLDSWSAPGVNTEFHAMLERVAGIVSVELEARKSDSNAFQALQSRPSGRGTVMLTDLAAMIQAGDREGVARAFETEVDWQALTDAEIRYHRRVIESIRRPDFSRGVYLIRGTNPELDPDPMSRGLLSKLFKHGAKKGLTLRELLDGYRDAWSATTLNRKWDLPFPQFWNLAESHSHSSGKNDGYPSAFISTTTSVPVTTSFAKGARVMIKVDSRRATPNFETLMHREREVLLPYFLFPDEIAGLAEKGSDRKWVVRRPVDGTTDEDATAFLRDRMARDVKAVDYLFEIWRATTVFFFPSSRQDVAGAAGTERPEGANPQPRDRVRSRAPSCGAIFAN